MSTRKIHRISSWSLYITLAVTVVMLGLFFFGGYVDAHAEMLEPVYTEPLLYWAYALGAMTIVATLGFSITQFIAKFSIDAKAGLRSLCWIGGFALLLFVCWILGDGTPLDILGYEGEENVAFWLKLTDMFLYAVYFLIAAPVLVMIFSAVASFFKK